MLVLVIESVLVELHSANRGSFHECVVHIYMVFFFSRKREFIYDDRRRQYKLHDKGGTETPLPQSTLAFSPLAYSCAAWLKSTQDMPDTQATKTRSQKSHG